ncbi:MAG: DNA ligase [Neisseria sp.]|nr:DNA ligase [Neisseria sp.]
MKRALFFALYLAFALPSFAEQRALMLAKEYQNQNVAGWLASEKLDGVRAFWDGKRLISRQGNVFTPPAGFTQNFPPFALDGELFSQRGQFEQISAATRSSNQAWTGIKLHVFDVPSAAGGLQQRLKVLQQHLQKHKAPNIVIIAQTQIANISQATEMMNKIVAAGGEGVILRHPNAPYASGRSEHYLKLKPHQDAECRVTHHFEGKGKYTGKLGAVGCKNELGEFKIGSGFSDAERSKPPAIGSLITYRHRGYTQKGLPRFATFLRVRNEK